MSLTIFVFTHKKFDAPENPLFRPLHVGRAGYMQKSAAGQAHGQLRDKLPETDALPYPGDDTGDSISHLNCYYSELTGMYWIWKNCHQDDYIGTCHYRRYLINGFGKIPSAEKYEELLRSYDLIAPRRVILETSYREGFSANHNGKVLQACGQVIEELFPQIAPYFDTLVNGNETYFGNILITSHGLFDEYCRFLFTVFFEVSRRVSLENGEDAYHKRVFGFISEFLLLVWVRAKGLRVYEMMVGIVGEKAETRECREALASYFEAGDLNGAMQYFAARHAARPDLCMEASDTDGRLRLAMQVIATANAQRAAGEPDLLTHSRNFDVLTGLMRSLNGALRRFARGQLTVSDETLLRGGVITPAAIHVAALLLPKQFRTQHLALQDEQMEIRNEAADAFSMPDAARVEAEICRIYFSK